MNYVLLSEKSWHESLYADLSSRDKGEKWTWIKSKEEFQVSRLKDLSADLVFIPHWSYIIPEEIFEQFECIVFHMTDLPFGRGGSPLQNLIVRGFEDTKISGLRVVRDLDAGDIYIKKNLELSGTAREIFERSSKVIKVMIEEIIDNKLEPTPQEGEPTLFSRRKPEEGNISKLEQLEEVYDFIRMLDADSYPKAFLETLKHKFEFSNAHLQDGIIKADVRITEK